MFVRSKGFCSLSNFYAAKLTSPAAKIATTRPKSTRAPVMAILVPRLIVPFSSFSADMQAVYLYPRLLGISSRSDRAAGGGGFQASLGMAH